MKTAHVLVCRTVPYCAVPSRFPPGAEGRVYICPHDPCTASSAQAARARHTKRCVARIPCMFTRLFRSPSLSATRDGVADPHTCQETGILHTNSKQDKITTSTHRIIRLLPNYVNKTRQVPTFPSHRMSTRLGGLSPSGFGVLSGLGLSLRRNAISYRGPL